MNARDMFYPEGKKFSHSEDRLYAREGLIYNVTEDITVAMEDLGVSKKELARRLGKSPSFVTQTLSGARNMTLGTLSDICFELGFQPRISAMPIESEQDIQGHQLNHQKLDLKKYKLNAWNKLKTLGINVNYNMTWDKAVKPISTSNSKSVYDNVIDATEHPAWGNAA